LSCCDQSRRFLMLIGRFEMNLKRVGDTDWPAAGAIPMK
jgi:hypothetical protein